jgi:hypothetical protein
MVTSRAGGAVRGRVEGRPLVSTIAAAVGAGFLLIGILGFIPGITTHYSEMQFAGHNSMAKLLGVFQVSVLHNLIHLAFGVAGLALSRTVSGARTFLIGGGVIYAVIWLYGVVVNNNSTANFVPFNTADNWLHFLLAVGMIGLGLATGRSVGEVARRR